MVAWLLCHATHAQIHWFSIFNSFMMVIFLTGLVSMILMRTLKKDYAKYAKEDDDLESLERDISEESGWKLVRVAVIVVTTTLVPPRPVSRCSSPHPTCRCTATSSAPPATSSC